MNRFKLIIDIMGSGFETVIIYYYLKAILGDCKLSRRNEILTYLLIMAILLITSTNYSNTIMVLLVLFILTLIGSMLYEGELFLKIIISLVLISLMILFEVISYMLIVSLTGKSMGYIFNNRRHYLQVALISKLLIFIVVKIFEYRKNTNYAIITQKILAPLVLMPITSVLVIYIVIDKAILNGYTYNILLIILIVSLLIIVNIYIFFIFEKQLKQEEEKIKLEFLKEQLKNQKMHFEELNDHQIRINKAVHDTKNQLLAVLGYVENNKNAKAIKTLNLLCHNIFRETSLVNTGNVAVDSLLNAKISKIRELDIELETYFLLEANLNMDEIDLCIVLGNILDNAIEACQQISIEKERKINLRVIQVEEHLSIEISNSKANKVGIEKDKISTTKKDKLFHGYGLENVKDIVEEYNGHIRYEQGEQIFTVRILLQNIISIPILQK